MQQIGEWAAFHHERLDGKGYPFGHSAKDLTLSAHIMAVADIFTTLAEDCPYRKGMDDESIKRIVNKMTLNGGIDRDVFGRDNTEFAKIWIGMPQLHSNLANLLNEAASDHYAALLHFLEELMLASAVIHKSIYESLH